MISVIIPTYNRAAYLARAVDSVLKQTFRDLELIIVDDGSTDATGEVLARLADRRVRVIRTDQGGVSRARNRGLSEARFPWVCFLDSDDEWNPWKLSRQLEVLEGFNEIRVIYTNEIWIRNGKRVNQKLKHAKFGGWIYNRCLPLCIISPSSVMIQRGLFDELGGFDTGYPVCEDYELWLRITAHNPVLFLDEPLITKYGGHPDQLSKSRWGMDAYRVEAMLKTFRSGLLSPLQVRWTGEEIIRKSEILAAGFTNRGKPEVAEEYRGLIRTWNERLRSVQS